jgi:hypothetical protein
MGLRARLRQKIEQLKELAEAIHEEAKFPGRPHSWKANTSPLYRDGDIDRKLRQADERPRKG